jgi:prepilin-type processing-associated H-X9-DG protein
MQCTNNLKQLGLAVHTFHDAQNGLPPGALGALRVGTHAFIMPYIEQNANWDRLNRPAIGISRDRRWWSGGTQGKNPNIPDVDELTDADRKGLASIPGYVCPSRRAAGATAPDNGVSDPVGNTAAQGPQTDYAFSIMGNPTSAQIASGGMYVHINGYWWSGSYYPGDAPYLEAHRGAFRAPDFGTDPGTIPGNWMWADEPGLAATGTWKPRDTLSWWRDGTSNQFVCGEKHIPSSLLGQCGAGNSPADGDCSYLSLEQYATVTAFRQFSFGWIDPPNASSGGRFVIGGGLGNGVWEFPLAKGNEKAIPPDQGAIYHQGFGSSHPGTSNFLFGDGAVRGVSVTTPVNPILYSLALVNDGLSVSLP